MAKRGGWDWEAYRLLKEWKLRPTPENMRLGGSILHLPTGRWMTFGEVDGEAIIALDGEVPEVIQASDCKRGWDPEVDPEEFDRELCNRKSAVVRYDHGGKQL